MDEPVGPPDNKHYDVMSLKGGYCDCPNFQETNPRWHYYYYGGVRVCKHMWWAAVMVAYGYVERIEHVELWYKGDRARAVKLGYCKIREISDPLGDITGRLKREGFQRKSYDGEWEVPIGRDGTRARWYSR